MTTPRLVKGGQGRSDREADFAGTVALWCLGILILGPALYVLVEAIVVGVS